MDRLFLDNSRGLSAPSGAPEGTLVVLLSLDVLLLQQQRLPIVNSLPLLSLIANLL